MAKRVDVLNQEAPEMGACGCATKTEHCDRITCSDCPQSIEIKRHEGRRVVLDFSGCWCGDDCCGRDYIFDDAPNLIRKNTQGCLSSDSYIQFQSIGYDGPNGHLWVTITAPDGLNYGERFMITWGAVLPDGTRRNMNFNVIIK